MVARKEPRTGFDTGDPLRRIRGGRSGGRGVEPVVGEPDGPGEAASDEAERPGRRRPATTGSPSTAPDLPGERVPDEGCPGRVPRPPYGISCAASGAAARQPPTKAAAAART